MNITSKVEKYLNKTIEDEFHRYKSWEICHQTFDRSKQDEIHVLELAFYLASWGMYRGSTGLLQKNHLVHKGAVDIIFSQLGTSLKCNIENEVSISSIANILKLTDKLSSHYSNIWFTRGLVNKPISATDTLITKIMLGTLGCVPAYDRYFIEGLRQTNMRNKSYNKSSLNELLSFAIKNKDSILESQQLAKDKTKKHYPVMKILDMYFWQIGYESLNS